MRDVYLAGAGAISHPGRGLAALESGLREPDIRPQTSQIREIDPPIAVPHLPAPNIEGDNRPTTFADGAVADALAGYDAEQRRAMPLFLASSTIDLIGRETPYTEKIARGEPALAFETPSTGLLAARVAVDHGVGGPQYTINTACSSGANALLYAAAAIRRGDCERALVLGVEVPSRVTLAGFQSLLLASGTRCRPFDRDRDGLMLGEASSAIVLSAHDEGVDTAGIRLLGGASACDSSNITHTDPDAVAGVITDALQDAGEPTIDAIKAHGTGTPSNDAAEALGIRRCLNQYSLPITSLKPALGHTLGACGVLETIAAAVCWRAGFLPPTAGFESPDPALDLAPVTEPTPLSPGRMLLNYFGFGGNNCALVLEYAP